MIRSLNHCQRSIIFMFIYIFFYKCIIGRGFLPSILWRRPLYWLPSFLIFFFHLSAHFVGFFGWMYHQKNKSSVILVNNMIKTTCYVIAAAMCTALNEYYTDTKNLRYRVHNDFSKITHLQKANICWLELVRLSSFWEIKRTVIESFK